MMKILKLIISSIFMVALCITTSAQHNHSGMGSGPTMKMKSEMSQNSQMNMGPAKTEILRVWGKCEMCKARIEKTVIAAGATAADWNVKTKMLTFSFYPTRTNVEYITHKLAKAGHDTGNNSAKDKTYNALPDCCKYERFW
jgi:periplasmic mercuric ion binding protein